MKEKILNFILNIKNIMTIGMTLVFLYQTIMGKIPVESFMTLFGMLVAWYFTKKKEPDTSTTETKTTSTTEVK